MNHNDLVKRTKLFLCDASVAEHKQTGLCAMLPWQRGLSDSYLRGGGAWNLLIYFWSFTIMKRKSRLC